MPRETPSSTEAALMKRLKSRRARIGVVGLGYVGLPLVKAMHDAGFGVVGFDIDQKKIDLLTKGKPYLKHLGTKLVRDLAASPRFLATSDPSELGACDAIAICVPTPLGVHDEPDLSYVVKSTQLIAAVLKPGMLVSLESTTYPGTTREVCLPILEAAGLRCGTDFFLCFSPEREDPGRKGIESVGIPRIVGGIDAPSGRLGLALYSAAVRNVMPVSSAEVAESGKLLENIYRAVNIALVNELKPVLSDMGIDIWEVIAAAATKPFGFQPFYPGPGLGGHCIPIDPYYLTYKAREFGHVTRFIELAGLVNRRMPHYVVERLTAALNQDGKAVKGARILILGIAYKPNIDDMRETPAAEIVELLNEREADVVYHDPHVPEFPKMRRHQHALSSVPLTPAQLKRADAVVIVTDHDAINWSLVAKHARLIVDTRNAMCNIKGNARVVKA